MEDTDKVIKTQKTGNKHDHFAFIIGAMKSGTTSLFDILSQHPQVCPSKIKEPDYFTKDNNESAHKDYLSLWDWHSDTHSIALESSVAYTKAPSITGVPERIYKSNLGSYRFIYMLRNPLTRIESQVRHGLFAGWGKSLDTGIPEDAINFSSYAMQLDQYLKYFPIDNILLVTLEEFKLNPDVILSRICQFLEIDKDFKFQDVRKIRNSGEFFNSSASVSRITQSSFGQFIAGKILPAKIKTLLRDTITRLSKGRNKTSNLARWQLTPEERNLVLNRLAGDLKRLESDFGVDIQKYWHIQPDILNKI
jgi:hypothetical protein